MVRKKIRKTDLKSGESVNTIQVESYKRNMGEKWC